MCGIGLQSKGIWRGIFYLATCTAIAVTSAEDVLTFRGGKDVYGRDLLCRSCHHLIGNLEESLVPRLVALSQDVRARQKYGAVEGLIQDVVPDACMFSATYHERSTWKQCQAILEAYEDDIIQLYYKFGQELIQGGNPAAASRTFNFNKRVCVEATRSCPTRLGVHQLAEFSDATNERVYKSERRPLPGEGDGLVLKLTAETFFEEVIAKEQCDTLVYFSFPRSHEGIHACVLPVLKRAAAMFNQRGPGGAPDPMRSQDALVAITRVDLELNSIPPPFGQQVSAPAIALYPASMKRNPRFMSNLKNGDLAVFDLLHFLSTAGASSSTKQLASIAQSTFTYEQLYLSVNDMHDREEEYDPMDFLIVPL